MSHVEKRWTEGQLHVSANFEGWAVVNDEGETVRVYDTVSEAYSSLDSSRAPEMGLCAALGKWLAWRTAQDGWNTDARVHLATELFEGLKDAAPMLEP